MRLAGFIGYLLIRFLALTIRIEWIHKERLRNVLGNKKQHVIYCFWHDRLLMMPLIALGQKATILISQHRDGEYISRILTWFGFGSIRGSSTRSGSLALRKMAREIRSGQHGAITPDGPKGPRHVAKEGAILLASLTGSPLVPLAFSSSKKKTFSSWDRFLIPIPFSRGVFMVGTPLWVPKNLSPGDMEIYRKRLEYLLLKITQEADTFVQ